MSDDLTLEKLRISERLATIEEKQDGFYQEVRSFMERHNIIIFGDGNGKKGVNIRLDRIEQKEQDRHKITWTLISANVVIVVKLVWDWLTHQR